MKISEASYIGKPHIYLNEVDSTNSYALLLISNNNPIEGTAISAGFQAAGRGQIGRSWWGEQGKNVFTSIILKPIHVKASAQWVINQSISLAIVNCLQEWIDAPVSIKWPNDIYVRDKKICGILIQCNLLGKNIHHAIIGIGLNVNQDVFPITLPNPTSLLLETGEECDLVEIRKVLYNSIEHYYEKTRSAQIISLRNEYHQQIYRKGLPTTFVKGDEIILGTIMGVDEIGRLRLLIGGREELFNFNELKMINNKDIL